MSGRPANAQGVSVDEAHNSKMPDKRELLEAWTDNEQRIRDVRRLRVQLLSEGRAEPEVLAETDRLLQELIDRERVLLDQLAPPASGGTGL